MWMDVRGEKKKKGGSCQSQVDGKKEGRKKKKKESKDRSGFLLLRFRHFSRVVAAAEGIFAPPTPTKPLRTADDNAVTLLSRLSQEGGEQNEKETSFHVRFEKDTGSLVWRE